MSITNEQVIDHISNMTVLDMANLVKELEEKFGVSAAPVAVAGGAAAGEAAEEKTEFDVVLAEAGAKKDQRN
jgi:large subunit ribosomal protein L7/L12